MRPALAQYASVHSTWLNMTLALASQRYFDEKHNTCDQFSWNRMTPAFAKMHWDQYIFIKASQEDDNPNLYGNLSFELVSSETPPLTA